MSSVSDIPLTNPYIFIHQPFWNDIFPRMLSLWHSETPSFTIHSPSHSRTSPLTTDTHFSESGLFTLYPLVLNPPVTHLYFIIDAFSTKTVKVTGGWAKGRDGHRISPPGATVSRHLAKCQMPGCCVYLDFSVIQRAEQLFYGACCFVLCGHDFCVLIL